MSLLICSLYSTFVNSRPREVIIQDMINRIHRGDIDRERSEAISVSPTKRTVPNGYMNGHFLTCERCPRPYASLLSTVQENLTAKGPPRPKRRIFVFCIPFPRTSSSHDYGLVHRLYDHRSAYIIPSNAFSFVSLVERFFTRHAFSLGTSHIPRFFSQFACCGPDPFVVIVSWFL